MERMRTPPFLETLADGEVILMPTAASARGLRRTYDARQRELGLAAWPSVEIFSWQQFLNSLWSQAVTMGAESRLLLNPAQEHALWLEVVQAKPFAANPASLESLSALAAQAWSLACAYDCARRLTQTANSHDTRAFAAWAADFARLCASEHCLASAGLASALAQHIAAHAVPLPSCVHLVDFAEITPAQRVALEALREAEVAVREHTLAADTPRSSVFIAEDANHELSAVAQHIRQRLESKPDTRIAIVLPDVSELAEVEAVFREVLAPELESVTADLSSAPWESESKGPLAAQAVVAAALQLLSSALTPQPIQAITELLLSPYIGSDRDRELAPRFDIFTLRDRPMLRPELDLAGLQRLAQGSSAPVWIRHVAALLSSSNTNTQRSHADWASFVRSLLRAAQWPGPRNLTGLEFQATEAFDALLDTLSTLDFRGRRVGLSEFAAALTKLSASTPFAPASTFAPVQILSASSVLAQQFDVLIVARATEANYPAREQANPLLSYALQASLGMPGASAEASARRAQATWTQPLHSADELLVTFARESDNGTQRISPLIESLAQPQPIELAIAVRDDAAVAASYTDDVALPPLPSTQISGGASVLKLQAACGFLAFAERRLRATSIDTLSPGFDALRSGNILHRTLEHFWQQTETQENLRSLTAQELREALDVSISHAMSSAPTPETTWDEAYLDVQRDRLLQVLTTWMKTELKRGPFTVLASEKQELITVGPLTLSVRMDRVDQVEGGHVFVDYKTGSTGEPKQWEGDRPDEPQLPLYALFSQPGELKALAFARVRAGKENKWTGYQAEEGILPIKGTRFIDDEIETWRTALAALAADFAAGVVDVNPKSFARNCMYCGQRLLCRVNPELLLSQLQEDEADDGDETA